MAGLKIKKGDRVQVLTGKDRGKEGTVIARPPRARARSSSTASTWPRSTRSRRSATMQGGIIDKDMPIPVSNVAIVCPATASPTRVGYRFDADGTKVRICRKCGGDV